MTSLERRRGPWTRKPISIVLKELENEKQSARRHLSFSDMVFMGVGGTIGSTIFVLSGLIASHFAGPASFVSFLLGGLAATFNGLCYAELAGRLPAAGSTYVYAYVSIGEWAAIIAAACQTMEYGASSAAVARGWGDKMIQYLVDKIGWYAAFLASEFFNPLSGLISALSVLCLACGVKESKTVSNVFSILKITLVLFMITCGLYFFKIENMTPFAPFGLQGILGGATTSFFGYLSFEEVCCLASEAKNPRDMPRAILSTLAIITTLYTLASIALTGMVPYEEISSIGGFPAAFASIGLPWASQITAVGELVTLPVVVLIALTAQPRICFALAEDGLLPSIFGEIDKKGNLFSSIIISGVPMIFVATFVPFSFLSSVISGAVLISYSLTDTALILMKCASASPGSLPLSWHLVLYHALSFSTGLISLTGSLPLTLGFFIFVCFEAVEIKTTFPLTGRFGGLPSSMTMKMTPKNNNITVVEENNNNNSISDDDALFEVPWMPFLPLLGISVNWYLVAQLEFTAMIILAVYLALIYLIYMFFHIRRRQSRTVPYSWIVESED